MSDPFELDPRLAADTFLVGETPLSQVLLMNDARYLWLILVPRRSDVTEPFELSEAECMLPSGASPERSLLEACHVYTSRPNSPA